MKTFFLIIVVTKLLFPLEFKANELNFQGLFEYSSNESEFKPFSNVTKADWAFGALNNLAKNRDCNFITRKSDLISSRESFTRHEAALIIKTCLRDLRNLSEEEKRLLTEFTKELESIENFMDKTSN